MAKIGIVGTGWGSRVQGPLFREAGLDVVEIVSPRKDWRRVVESDRIDLVSVVSPPSMHREMLLAALEAGKHVLCEKPTARNAAEAMDMLEAARRKPGQIAIIDHELRFLPSWREARRRIGELGSVRYVEVRYASPSRGDRTREWNWWSDASQGGGIWGAVGSHFVDALRYFGLEIEAVQGVLRTTIDRRPFASATREVTSDDFATVDMRLAGGAAALMTFSAVTTGPDEPSVMTIYAEGGAMRFIGEEVLLSRSGAPFETVERRAPRPAGAIEKRPGNSPGGAFGSGTLHLGRALRKAIDDGDRDALAPAATIEDGLMQQRVLDAARRSSASGNWESV